MRFIGFLVVWKLMKLWSWIGNLEKVFLLYSIYRFDGNLGRDLFIFFVMFILFEKCLLF